LNQSLEHIKYSLFLAWKQTDDFYTGMAQRACLDSTLVCKPGKILSSIRDIIYPPEQQRKVKSAVPIAAEIQQDNLFASHERDIML
jgi:hypothetical protein